MELGRRVMAMLKITGKLKVGHLRINAAVQQFKDGHIDGLFYSPSDRYGPIINLAQTRKIRAVPLPKWVIDRIIKETPSFFRTRFPKLKGVYKGLVNSVDTIAFPNVILANRNRISSDQAYAMVKAVAKAEAASEVTGAHGGKIPSAAEALQILELKGMSWQNVVACTAVLVTGTVPTLAEVDLEGYGSSPDQWSSAKEARKMGRSSMTTYLKAKDAEGYRNMLLKGAHRMASNPVYGTAAAQLMLFISKPPPTSRTTAIAVCRTTSAEPKRFAPRLMPARVPSRGCAPPAASVRNAGSTPKSSVMNASSISSPERCLCALG